MLKGGCWPLLLLRLSHVAQAQAQQVGKLRGAALPSSAAQLLQAGCHGCRQGGQAPKTMFIFRSRREALK
jgi:hypothetical protein